MNKAQKRRLKQIIRRQNEIKEKARVKRNIRLMALAQRREEAERNKLNEKLKHTIRIRDRHLIQLLRGTISDKALAKYTAMGLDANTLQALVDARPGLRERAQFAGLALEPVSGQQ